MSSSTEHAAKKRKRTDAVMGYQDTSHAPSVTQPSISKFWLLPEMLREVRSHSRQQDFATLCLASRPVYGVANGILYETPTLDVWDKKLKSFSAIYNTLKTSQDIANCVKSLRIHFRNPNADEEEKEEFRQRNATDCDRDDREINLDDGQGIKGEPLPHLTALSRLIQKTPNLQVLRITDRFPLSAPSVQELDRSFDCVTSLKTFEFDLREWRYPPHSPGEYDVNAQILKHALCLPSLHNLILTLQEGPDGDLAKSNLPLNNNITSLCLRESCIRFKQLERLIAATPNLRQLNLELLIFVGTGFRHVNTLLDCEELMNAMAICRPSLESLKIVATFEARTALDVTAGNRTLGDSTYTICPEVFYQIEALGTLPGSYSRMGRIDCCSTLRASAGDARIHLLQIRLWWLGWVAMGVSVTISSHHGLPRDSKSLETERSYIKVSRSYSKVRQAEVGDLEN